MPQPFDLLQQLHLLLQASTTAYRDYLDGGKTFRDAQRLHSCNNEARELLVSGRHLLPVTLQPHADALIHHYEVWTQKWDALEAVLRPIPDQEFVFANASTFPRAEAGALERYYLEWKEKQRG